MASQIPEEIIDILFQSMVYKPFLKKYIHVLEYEKENVRHSHERYTWRDLEYRKYMKHIISILEPREEQPGTTLVSELDEFLEVTFFISGSVHIGYSINNKVKYCLQY